MRYYFITFRSVTYAQRGEKLLTSKGYRCAMGRTPRWMEEQGCGYALTIRGKSVEAAVALLRQEQVPMRRVYQKREDGQWEELAV